MEINLKFHLEANLCPPVPQLPCLAGDVRASGSCKPWDDSPYPEISKFKEFGWRNYKTESSYTPETLVGNWLEERHETKYIKIPRGTILGQFSNMYETTNSAAYGRYSWNACPFVKYAEIRPPAFPGHQQVLPNCLLNETCRFHKPVPSGTLRHGKYIGTP